MHVHLSLHFEAGVCLWNVGSMLEREVINPSFHWVLCKDISSCEEIYSKNCFLNV